jgi:hypothetical protein
MASSSNVEICSATRGQAIPFIVKKPVPAFDALRVLRVECVADSGRLCAVGETSCSG